MTDYGDLLDNASLVDDTGDYIVSRLMLMDAIRALREQVAALQPPEPDAQKKIVSEMADDYDRMGDPEIAAALRSCLSRAEAAERERDALRQDAERYRWLRGEAGKVEPKASVMFRRNEEWVNVWDGLSLDAAIDARAMGEWRGKAIDAALLAGK